MAEHEYPFEGQTTAGGPEPAQAHSEPTGSEPTGQKEPSANFVDELTALGNKLAELVQVAWNSEDRRRIESQIKKGLSVAADGIEQGVQKLRESEQTKEFMGKAEDVADDLGEKVRTSKVANEMADTIMKGLRVLGEQLDEWANELQERTAEQRTAGTPPAEPPSQDIPVDKV